MREVVPFVKSCGQLNTLLASWTLLSLLRAYTQTPGTPSTPGTPITQGTPATPGTPTVPGTPGTWPSEVGYVCSWSWIAVRVYISFSSIKNMLFSQDFQVKNLPTTVGWNALSQAAQTLSFDLSGAPQHNNYKWTPQSQGAWFCSSSLQQKSSPASTVHVT